MFAASPLSAMRSAPKTTASTSPRANSCPAATSAISVCGMPSCELPCGQSRALQQRTRLVHPDVEARIVRVGRAHDAKCRAVPAGREGAGIAVGEHSRPGRQKPGAVRAHREAARHLVVVDAPGERGQSRAQLVRRAGGRRDHLVAALECPAEIDRGRPRARELALGRASSRRKAGVSGAAERAPRAPSPSPLRCRSPAHRGSRARGSPRHSSRRSCNGDRRARRATASDRASRRRRARVGSHWRVQHAGDSLSWAAWLTDVTRYDPSFRRSRCTSPLEPGVCVK